MINCLFVGLGGFIGVILRYLITLIPVNNNNIFPYKTLVINVLGSFIIGIISAYALKHINFDEKLVLMIKVGICGGFTTFSTFALESYNLFENNHAILSIIYIILSVTLCITFVFLGTKIVG